VARADIPPGYAGTPYKGTPQVVPGRLELEFFDEGGPGVGYQHHAGEPASGADLGRGAQPPICATNAISVDKMVDGGPYPQTGNPKSYYVCQCHAGEWVSLTVDVKQAGTYLVSTTFATVNAGIEINLSANGVDKTGSVKLVGTSNYHIWKTFDDFTKVQLDAGLQVLRFTAVEAGLQQDYLELRLEGGASDGGAVAADASAAGGAGGAAGAVGSAGSAGGGPTTGAAGVSGAAGAGTIGSGGSGGGGGLPGSSGAGGASAGSGTPGAAGATGPGGSGAAGSSPPAPGTPLPGTKPPAHSSGCALVPSSSDGTAATPVWFLLLAILAGRRRRAARHR
jgi:hypothetical protein